MLAGSVHHGCFVIMGGIVIIDHQKSIAAKDRLYRLKR